MPNKGSDRYPEMDWRAVDKVAAWRLFKKKMTIYFIADGTPKEQQYAKVLVSGCDEAMNQWQIIEAQMQAEEKNPATDIKAFWDAFEKSFEQTTSHWHFINQYLSDFRQEPDETTADLDLRIKELVKGCKFQMTRWRKESWSYCSMPLILFVIHEHIVDTPGVTYEDCIKKAKQHERTVTDFRDHAAFSRSKR